MGPTVNMITKLKAKPIEVDLVGAKVGMACPTEVAALY